MRNRVFLLVVALMLAACAYSPRSSAPVASFVAPQGVDEVARCIIQNLNALPGNSFGRMAPVTHALSTTDPGRVYEIAPQQTLVSGGELYFVRLTKEAVGTRVEVFAPSGASDIAGAAQACASQPR